MPFLNSFHQWLKFSDWTNLLLGIQNQLTYFNKGTMRDQVYASADKFFYLTNKNKVN